jgi:hypothetical protein
VKPEPTKLELTRDDAARAEDALSRGDALDALRIAGRAQDVVARMLRGVAYAQLGDLELASKSLEEAAAADEPILRARARAALVEIRLAEGDAVQSAREADAIARELDRLGDARNAAMQRLVAARARVLAGRIDEARIAVEDELRGAGLDDNVRGVAALVRAEIAIRSRAAREAEAAIASIGRSHALLDRAARALEEELHVPVACIVRGGVVTEADLFAIEAALSGEHFVVDACRRFVRAGRATVPLGTRPVLFSILVALAEAWPRAAFRDVLVESAFDAKKANESHRARLRVEVGRLRRALEGLAALDATKEGYALRSSRDVVLVLPKRGDDVAVLLGDGAAWSAETVSEHLGVSLRTAQRALARLVETGEAVRVGRSRWVTTRARMASRLLLLGLVRSD